MRVLLIEDDLEAARVLARGLREEGWIVDIAHSGESGDEMAGVNTYDAIILDWLLPDRDGITVCRGLRARGLDAPILMLTARDTVEDRVTGLNAGADDYLTKPFSFAELLARLHAILRRSDLTRPVLLTVEDLTLDPRSHLVTRGGSPLSLTPKEYAILEALMRHAGDVVSRGYLSEHLWEDDRNSVMNLVDVHVGHLRRKVDQGTATPLIHTVRGAGYRLGPADCALGSRADFAANDRTRDGFAPVLSRPRILLIDDDQHAARVLARGLREEGWIVDIAHSGESGDEMAGVNTYDAIILDWLLPDRDGITVCRGLREGGLHAPILMLTARDTVEDRVTGLNAGADDYLTKPFSFAELLARLHAILRRSDLTRPVLLAVEDLRLDPCSHLVTRGGSPLSLTPKEYAILETLMRHAGEMVSRVYLSEHLWEDDRDSLMNLVDVHVGHLRRKVDQGTAAPLIHTVRGCGYRLGPASGC
jgi:DNA-binding response OmpR family regulator